MRISIAIRDRSPGHTHFAVFMNGGKAGELTLRNEEFLIFCDIINSGVDEGFADGRGTRSDPGSFAVGVPNEWEDLTSSTTSTHWPEVRRRITSGMNSGKGD